MLISYVLPYHPYPLIGESISSYLCRISENNRILNIPTLQTLLFPDVQIRNLRNFNEFKPGNMKTICKSLNLSFSDFQTSLWNLSLNFGRPMSPQVNSKFVGSFIDCYRKFCPLCLKENNIIHLVWKFKNVTVCLDHKIFLLDECLNCNRKIKNLPQNLSNIYCPYCYSDLRRQKINNKNIENDLCKQTIIQSNLSFLLKKVQIKYKDFLSTPNSKILGRKLKQIRIENQLSVPSLSKKSKLKIYDIENLEYGLLSRGIGDLRKYLQYLSSFNISVIDFFKR